MSDKHVRLTCIADAPGSDEWTLRAEHRPSGHGGGPSMENEYIWPDAPSALNLVLSELFLERPDDVLSWLHNAVWRLHALEVNGVPAWRGPSCVSLQQSSPRFHQPCSPPSGQHKFQSDMSPQISDPSSNDRRSGIQQDEERQTFESGRTPMASTSSQDTSGQGRRSTRRLAQLKRTRSWLSYGDARLWSVRALMHYVGGGSGLNGSNEEHLRDKQTIDDATRTIGVLAPMGTVRWLWDQLLCVCLMYSLWSLSLELALGSYRKVEHVSQLEYLCLVVFATDILLNFNTGYLEGDVVMLRRRCIVVNYCRLGLWLDLAAFVPYFVALMMQEPLADNMSSVRLASSVTAYTWLKSSTLLRAARFLHTQWMASKAMAYLNCTSGATFLLQFFRGHIALATLCHVDALLWGACEPEGVAGESITREIALARYAGNLSRIYSALSFGTDPPVRNDLQQIILATMCLQRLSILVFVLAWLMWKMSCVAAAEASEAATTDLAVAHMKMHHVSASMQLKVLRTLNEASRERRQQVHFDRIVRTDLPSNLSKSVLNEMWSERLMTLDLFLHCSRWSPAFLPELALSVSEVFLSGTGVVFSADETSDAAYLMLRGSVMVMHQDSESGECAFTPGMWVGEKALLNPQLRRNETVVCMVSSQLMKTPADIFHKLLAQFNMEELFQMLLQEQLWLGLCGRCGKLGDHYASACPYSTKQTSRASLTSQGSPAQVRRRNTKFFEAVSERSDSATATTSERPSVVAKAIARMSPLYQRSIITPVHSMNAELLQFLKVHHLEHLSPTLARLGIQTLNDVSVATADVLRRDPSLQLTDDEAQVLSQSSVHAFRRKVRRRTAELLVQPSSDQHYLFISHYKAEGGSVAALMQDALVRMVKDDPSCIGHRMAAPVFIDTEDLKDLGDIRRHVSKSHNLVILLTTNVLTRPWCLLEIVTAIESGANILPVRVDEPRNPFEFPNENYFRRLRERRTLDQSCLDFLSQAGIDLAALESALRQLFRRIAIPFSPQRPANIRTAELAELLRQCRPREALLASRSCGSIDCICTVGDAERPTEHAACGRRHRPSESDGPAEVERLETSFSEGDACMTTCV